MHLLSFKVSNTIITHKNCKKEMNCDKYNKHISSFRTKLEKEFFSFAFSTLKVVIVRIAFVLILTSPRETHLMVDYS